MKRKDISALHAKDQVELTKELSQKKMDLAKLVSERRVKPGKNTRAFKMLKDDIARIYTVLHLVSLKEKVQK